MANFATTFVEPVTAAEAFERAGLAFNVVAEPMFLRDGTQTGRVAQRRDDTGEILGYSAPGYVATQPRDVARMVDSTASAAGVAPRCVRIAGIHKGKLCVGIELPSAGLVVQRLAALDNSRADALHPYAFLGTDWDGENSLFARLQMFRPWCSNQYTSASLSAQIRVRHNRAHGFGVERACELLAGAPRYAESLAGRAQLMADTRLPSGALRDTVGRIAFAETTGAWELAVDGGTTLDGMVELTFGRDLTPRRVNRYRETAGAIRDLTRTGTGNDGTTYWDVLNGTTEWANHMRPERRGSSRQAHALLGAGAAFMSQAESFVHTRALREAAALTR